MNANELTRSHFTFKLCFDKSENKGKLVDFKNTVTDHGDQVYSETYEDVNDSIAMFSRNFAKVMRRLQRCSRKNVYLVINENPPQQ